MSARDRDSALVEKSSFERQPRSSSRSGFNRGSTSEEEAPRSVARQSYKRESSFERAPRDEESHPSNSQIKRATRTRLIWSLITSVLLLIAVVFVVMVEIGDIKINPVMNKIYFIKLDLSDIVPVRVPNANLINSIAQSLGLHDFYTVGLWSFCEGYNGQGVTNCSKAKPLYWFNPVEILSNELLAGATSML